MKVCIVSPHIDDAILSCGGFISNALRRPSCHIHIVNLFCGIKSEREQMLNIDRVFEEHSVMRNGLITYLPIPDVSQRLDYFSWDGVFVKPEDSIDVEMKSLVNVVEKELSQYVVTSDYDMLFFPMGYGDHKDHVIASLVGRKLSNSHRNIYFYRDMPYLNKGVWCDDSFKKEFMVYFDLEDKLSIAGYYTNAVLVGDDIIKNVKEQHINQNEPSETYYAICI